jgi:glucokinase
VERPFVLVSGLPGSGKSTLAVRIGAALELPVLDKDWFLESLFELKGTGDAAWRRRLSRESDSMLQAEAAASNGSVLVSHWRLPGMAANSGTPWDWVLELSRRVVHVHCECDPETAARRFFERRRHQGHGDDGRNHPAVLASIRETATLGMPGLLPVVMVDTSGAVLFEAVVREVRENLASFSL